MRINEDFIDEPNVQDVITSDDEQLPLNYPYYFFFTTTTISKRLPPNLCIQMMSKFCSMFTRMVKGLPFVKRFNSDYFRIYMGGSYLFKDPEGRGSGKHPYEPFIYYSYNTVELPGGFKLVFSDEDNVVTLDDYYHNQKSSSMNFGFFINIDANMENISRIQRMYVTLWQLFDKALKHSFGFWCTPNCIYYYEEGINIFEIDIPYLALINLDDWQGDSNLSNIFLTRALRQYNQDMDVIEATRQVNEFITSLKNKKKK